MLNGITGTFVTPSCSRIGQYASNVRTEKYLRPEVQFLLSINVCLHLLYEILSKSDVKYTKYELNIIYVRKHSMAVTKPPVTKPSPAQRHQLDIYTDFCPNRIKNVENWATFHERVRFTAPIFTTLKYCLT